jgi:CRISPR-associated protein Cas1
MTTLYLTDQGSTLRRENERLIVKNDDGVVNEIPLIKVDRVVVLGRVHLTTGAVNSLLTSGIDTTFLSSRGQLRGRLTALESKNAPLRLKQYGRASDAPFCFEIARRLVRSKITSSMRVILRYGRNHPEADFQAQMRELERALLSGPRAETLDGLRGIEGHAAAVYFSTYGQMFRGPLRFHKRTRRPPLDPVNAVLSFGYTLLTSETIGMVSAVGFDPYIGFFHAMEYGRCSLALDLIEEFRAAIIDRMVLTMFNNQMLSADDFQPTETGGVWLADDGKKRFLAEYDRTMSRKFVSRHTGHQTTFRRLILGQAERLARAVQYNEQYEPYEAEH